MVSAPGFPLLTTLALQTSSTAHSAVVVGLLPLATATMSAMWTGRRPAPLFWVASGAGAAIVALPLCAAGYARGGMLTHHMPGWQVIA